MSMSTAMMSALSGLRASQSGLDIVANNVANAGSANYTRKAQQNQERIAGSDAVGVNAGEVTRILDRLIQRQLWTEGAGGSYTATKTAYHERLDGLFGTPGDASSLDGLFNSFTQSLQTLASSPDNSTARSEVLNNAQILTRQLNGLSTDVQSMRSQTELALATAVEDANEALRNIERIGEQIRNSPGGGPASPALLDERDGYISRLGSLMDIKVVAGERDQISIFTSSGALLFDGEAATLSFDGRGELTPQSLYSTDASQRGVGTLTLTSSNGAQTDLIASKLVRSGEIGALIELRDDVLVEAQTQLDTLAAQMSLAISNRTAAGTPATAGGATGFSVDLAGLQNGNPITFSFRSGGVPRQAVFVEVGPGTPLPLPPSANGGATGVQTVGYTGGAAGAAAAIGATLGAGFTVSASGSVLTVLDDGVAGTTDVNALSASVTNTLLSGGGKEFPLFVDAGRGTLYTGTFDGGSQRLGYAARIAVNRNVLADPSLLVRYDSTTQSADATRPAFLLDALTKTSMAMPPDTGIGGTANPFQASVGAFARAVVETQGRNAQTAANIDAGQKIVVNALAGKFQKTSGVNIDTEMSNLLELQNAYAANARVMSTIRDMLNTLMNM
jgi:flagellar hook-associated protein 1 FlgK